MKSRFLWCTLIVAALLIGCQETPEQASPMSPDGVRIIGGKVIPAGVTVPEGYAEYREALAANANITQPPLQNVQSVATSGELACWEPNIGSGLEMGDDWTEHRDLGFTFTFYGVDYTSIYINSNGNLTFGHANWTYDLTNIPSESYRIIAPLYGDLNPAFDGIGGTMDVFYNVIGSAPNRQAVITWNIVPEFSSVEPNTFQVILFEGTNVILFGYNGLTTDGFNWTSSAMSVGISSGTGSYINVASGSAILDLDGTNLMFLPVDASATDYALIRECSVSSQLTVEIDIKPGSDVNSINLKSNGVIPVAILTTDAFDATTVDGSTVLFEGASAVHGGHLEDVDGDGDLDWLGHFKVQETNLGLTSTTGTLTGQTNEGTDFEASDDVWITPGSLKGNTATF